MYAKYIKRLLDLCVSAVALVVLSPVLLVLIVVGAIAMRGNPFFFQARPGRIGKDGKEKIFKLIKFRTMSNAKDKDGNFLPDSVRLNKYGRILRSTSLDELPELINIVKGDMSLVGPRPLTVRYLPYYTDEERLRHTVRPGLTGLAQVNGRNHAVWEERFAYDVKYVKNIRFGFDCKILWDTVWATLKRKDIAVVTGECLLDFDKHRKQQWEMEKQYEHQR
jgi:lipopolysaccharide/colanic/teichoic acid biosynthesis glycosyltransferase